MTTGTLFGTNEHLVHGIGWDKTIVFPKEVAKIVGVEQHTYTVGYDEPRDEITLLELGYFVEVAYALQEILGWTHYWDDCQMDRDEL